MNQELLLRRADTVLAKALIKDLPEKSRDSLVERYNLDRSEVMDLTLDDIESEILDHCEHFNATPQRLKYLKDEIGDWADAEAEEAFWHEDFYNTNR